MQLVRLTQGKFAKVDDDIMYIISQYKWHFHKTGYAMHTYDGGKKLRMHHVVLPMLPRHEVDHINGDTLDNRRENLRYTSRIQNSWNRGKQSNNTSGYKGVQWSPWCNKWAVRIVHNKKEVRVGYFEDVADAAEAYNQAAILYHGDYARLNVVP